MSERLKNAGELDHKEAQRPRGLAPAVASPAVSYCYLRRAAPSEKLQVVEMDYC